MTNELNFSKEQFNSFCYTLLFNYSMHAFGIGHLKGKQELTEEEKKQVVKIINKIENFNKQQNEESIQLGQDDQITNEQI